MNTAQAARAKEELLRQACINASIAEMRARIPNNPPSMVRYWIIGRFGNAPFGGHQGGLSNIVDTIRAEYRLLASRHVEAA